MDIKEPSNWDAIVEELGKLADNSRADSHQLSPAALNGFRGDLWEAYCCSVPTYQQRAEDRDELMNMSGAVDGIANGCAAFLENKWQSARLVKARFLLGEVSSLLRDEAESASVSRTKPKSTGDLRMIVFWLSSAWERMTGKRDGGYSTPLAGGRRRGPFVSFVEAAIKSFDATSSHLKGNLPERIAKEVTALRKEKWQGD